MGKGAGLLLAAGKEEVFFTEHRLIHFNFYRYSSIYNILFKVYLETDWESYVFENTLGGKNKIQTSWKLQCCVFFFSPFNSKRPGCASRQK